MFEHSIKNLYIGEYKEWAPWENTIAYYPLTSSSTNNDESWNWHTLTNYNVSFWALSGVDCATNSWNANLFCNLWLKISDYDFTINTWVYKTWGKNTWVIRSFWNPDSSSIYLAWTSWRSPYLAFWNTVIFSWASMSNNTWYNICCTYNSSTLTGKIYINGQLSASSTLSSALSVWDNNVWLLNGSWVGRDDSLYGWLSRTIIEKTERSDTDTAMHYNVTKSNYWL